MAKRTIIWTRTADLQFTGVLAYWVEKNNSAAYSKKLIHLVSEKTNQLSELPFIGKSVAFDTNTRVVSLGHFSLFYKTSDSRIVITAFWDNRQNPKELLNILKNQ